MLNIKTFQICYLARITSNRNKQSVFSSWSNLQITKSWQRFCNCFPSITAILRYLWISWQYPCQLVIVSQPFTSFSFWPNSFTSASPFHGSYRAATNAKVSQASFGMYIPLPSSVWRVSSLLSLPSLEFLKHLYCCCCC